MWHIFAHAVGIGKEAKKRGELVVIGSFGIPTIDYCKSINSPSQLIYRCWRGGEMVVHDTKNSSITLPVKWPIFRWFSKMDEKKKNPARSIRSHIVQHSRALVQLMSERFAGGNVCPSARCKTFELKIGFMAQSYDASMGTVGQWNAFKKVAQ